VLALAAAGRRRSAKARRLLARRFAAAAAALAFALFASVAGAEISGSASIVSDYRYRGVTLSGKKPAAQVGVSYDHALGFFAGAFASTIRLTPPYGPGLLSSAYSGYAWRLPSGITLEAGGDYFWFDDAARYNYGEVFAGVGNDSVSVRLHYSQRYWGFASDSLYAEINYAQPLVDPVRLIAHAGFLRLGSDTFYASGSDRRVLDAQIGIAADFDLFRVQVAWVGISRANAASGIMHTTSTNTVTLTLSRAF